MAPGGFAAGVGWLCAVVDLPVIGVSAWASGDDMDSGVEAGERTVLAWYGRFLVRGVVVRGVVGVVVRDVAGTIGAGEVGRSSS
jgi:hypothetical protein